MCSQLALIRKKNHSNFELFLIDRFLHPGDSNWPGLKPHEKRMNTAISSAGFGNLGSRRRSNSEISAWNRNKKPNYSERLERHSNALVSQTDLFLQCKVESDDTTRERRSQLHHRVNPGQDDARNRGRERKRGRESTSRHASPNSSGHYDMRDSLNRRRTSRSQPYYVNILCSFIELISRLTENTIRNPEMQTLAPRL